MKTYEIPVEFKASYILPVYVRAESAEEAVAWLKNNRKPQDLIEQMDSESVSDAVFDDFWNGDDNEDFDKMLPMSVVESDEPEDMCENYDP